jgi:hypothetical protein
MKTSATLKSGKRLWGIYYTDPEYAREMGDPVRTVVEAPNKLIAEESAAQLGFGDSWAHPVSSVTARQAQWPPKRRPGHRQELVHKPSRGIHI